MAKRNSKRRPGNSKAKKNRQKQNQSSLKNEKQSKPKSSFEEIADIFLGNNPEENPYGYNIYGPMYSNENTSNAEESTAETTPAQNTAGTGTGSKTNDDIKAQQQEILNNLKSLNDAVAAMVLTRDNVASLRIEVLSNIFFTREIRPLIDAVNLISFASSNISNVANNININSSGDRKEIKNAFKLCYKMNDEIYDMLGALTRRIKLYIAQLNNMDKNCPPSSCDEDSQD